MMGGVFKLIVCYLRNWESFFLIEDNEYFWSAMKIWQIDPANITPYYDIALCHALASENQQVRFISSRFLYDKTLVYPDTFTTDFRYFRLLEDERLLHFPRLRKGMRALTYPITHRGLLRDIKHHKPDIVHFQWSRLPIFDRWLIAQIRALGIPVVHTIHDVDPLFGQGYFTGELKDVYEQVDALVVHTKDSQDQFLSTYQSIPPSKVHIIPILTMDDPNMPADASLKSAREKLKIHPNAFVSMFFGGIKYYKGIDILANAIPLVHEKNPEVQFWIVGRPDMDQLDLLNQLRKKENVVIVADYVPSELAWQYFLSADIHVFPYRHIFQSGALISTLGYGCAVIVTDVGGLPELVDGNGWVVPPEDPQALAEAICNAAEDRDQLKRMGQRSREIVITRTSPAHVASEYIKLYESLVTR